MVSPLPALVWVIRLKKKKELTFWLTPWDLLAGSKGLEPSASGVTGRRYNQLNYDPAFGKHTLVGETGLEPVTLGL
jgi:hypothetical protein